MKTFMQTLREARLSEEIPVNPDSMSQQSPSGFDYMDDEQSFDDINDLQDAASSNPHLMRAKQNGDYYFQMSKEQLNPDRAEVFLRIAKKYYDVARFVANLDLTDLSEAKKGDPCWDGYKMEGMKKKGKKQVPNCVKEETLTELSAKTLVKYIKKAPNSLKDIDAKTMGHDSAEKTYQKGANRPGLAGIMNRKMAWSHGNSADESDRKYAKRDSMYDLAKKKLKKKLPSEFAEETLKEFAVAPEDQQAMQLQKKIQNLQASLVAAQQQLNTVNGKKLQRTKQLQQKAATSNQAPNPMGSGI